MHGAAKRRPDFPLALVLTLSVVVHAGAVESPSAFAQGRAQGKSSTTAAKAKPRDDVVPTAVSDMVEAIQAAVHSGRIAELRDAVDWNEMKPDLGPGLVSDPVAYWRSISTDGEGRDILDVLGKLLAGKPAVRPLGRDVENNRLYIWPRFADSAISALSKEALDALADLVPADELRAMRDADRYTGWRLVLGADGVWHSFRRD